jgi:branched-subunit amino acid transport protein
VSAWITLGLASLLTLALRAGPSLLGSGRAVPAGFLRANRFASPALMGALASRGVATQAATTGWLPIVASIVAAVVIARRTHSMAATIAAGTAVHLAAVAMIG